MYEEDNLHQVAHVVRIEYTCTYETNYTVKLRVIERTYKYFTIFDKILQK